MSDPVERYPVEAPYSAPSTIASLDDCYFYHTMDVPGHGVVEGEWDLHGAIPAYLGNFDFAAAGPGDRALFDRSMKCL